MNAIQCHSWLKGHFHFKWWDCWHYRVVLDPLRISKVGIFWIDFGLYGPLKKLICMYLQLNLVISWIWIWYNRRLARVWTCSRRLGLKAVWVGARRVPSAQHHLDQDLHRSPSRCIWMLTLSHWVLLTYSRGDSRKKKPRNRPEDLLPAKTKQVTVTELQVEEEEGAGGEAGGR